MLDGHEASQGNLSPSSRYQQPKSKSKKKKKMILVMENLEISFHKFYKENKIPR